MKILRNTINRTEIQINEWDSFFIDNSQYSVEGYRIYFTDSNVYIKTRSKKKTGARTDNDIIKQLLEDKMINLSEYLQLLIMVKR